MKRLDGKIGIDGAGAVSDEEGEVHHLTGFAAFNDERNLGAGLLAHQAVVYGGHGKQAGDGARLHRLRDRGEMEGLYSGVDGMGGACAFRSFQRMLQTGFSVRSAEKSGQGCREKISGRNYGGVFQDRVSSDRMGQLQRVGILVALR